MEHSLSISTAASERSQDSLSSPISFMSSTPLMAKQPLRLSPLRKKREMRVEGHRGAGLLEPENSLKAFQRAIDLGIDGVELDVWLSKDGIPIVIHGIEDDGGRVHFNDRTLNNFAYELHSHTLKDLILTTGEPIPTLEEVLLLCKDKIHVNIEIKEENDRVIKPTLELVMRHDMLNQVTFSSFKHKHKTGLELARKELACEQSVEFGFLVWVIPDFAEYIDMAAKGDCLSIDVGLLLKHEEFILAEIAKAKAKEMKIKFYFGFEQEETDEIYKRLEDLKVDTLIVNHPHKSMAYLTEAGIVF